MSDEDFKKNIARIIKLNFNLSTQVEISQPPKKFGDYATNVALQLAKQLHQKPIDIAQTIAQELRKNPAIQSVDVVNPGFINISLSDQTIIDQLQEIITRPNYGQSNLFKDQKIVSEFSDPNPFKALHVGHFYTSIIGESISLIIEQAGGKVHRVNFGGDVGLHVAKSIWSIINQIGGEYPQQLSKISKDERVEWMANNYIKGNEAYENNPDQAEQIKKINQQIYAIHQKQDHQSDLAQIYWTCWHWSYDYFKEFYQKINIQFEKFYPESLTTPIGIEKVKEGLKKNIFQKSQGAVIFPGSQYGLHDRVFINQQGLPTYETKDLGLNFMKMDDYHFDLSIIITGNDIIEYMKVILKAVEQFDQKISDRTKHITHGNVRLSGGVKISSRKGNGIDAYYLIDLITQKAQEINHTQEVNFDLVLSAIKYAFLKTQIGQDIILEPDEIVSLKGNSGIYLQYSLVRAKSIIKKVKNNQNLKNTIHNLDQNEKKLILKLLQYPSINQESTQQLKPNIICNYVFELCQVFNQFYEKSPIIGQKRQNLRLKIIEAYIIIMETNFKKLGLPIMDRI